MRAVTVVVVVVVLGVVLATMVQGGEATPTPPPSIFERLSVTQFSYASQTDCGTGSPVSPRGQLTVTAPPTIGSNLSMSGSLLYTGRSADLVTVSGSITVTNCASNYCDKGTLRAVDPSRFTLADLVPYTTGIQYNVPLVFGPSRVNVPPLGAFGFNMALGIESCSFPRSATGSFVVSVYRRTGTFSPSRTPSRAPSQRPSNATLAPTPPVASNVNVPLIAAGSAIGGVFGIVLVAFVGLAARDVVRGCRESRRSMRVPAAATSATATKRTAATVIGAGTSAVPVAAPLVLAAYQQNVPVAVAAEVDEKGKV